MTNEQVLALTLGLAPVVMLLSWWLTRSNRNRNDDDNGTG